MHAEFLLEEPSAEAVLDCILPRLLPDGVTFDLHVFQGKPDLLHNLEQRLRAYGAWIPDDWRIVVLIDEDRQDCKALKRQLEDAASNAGLATRRPAPDAGRFQILNRLAVEELEAWFLGDVDALRMAYPRLPASFGRGAGFRDPDAVRGGTAEALERELQRSGYYASGLPKIETARRIAEHMDPDRNRSHSFRVFREGLRALCR